MRSPARREGPGGWLSLAALALVGCGGRPWLTDACDADASVAAEVVVRVDEHGLALHPISGAPTRVDTDACLGRRAGGVVALGGQRALAWSWEAMGGNWIESGRVGGQRVCVVDFAAGTATERPSELLGRDFRHVRAWAGAASGRVYVDEALDPLRVVDVASGAAVDLAIDAEGAEQVAIAELGDRLRAVGTRFEQIDAERPIYRHFLVVAEYDASAWPVVERARREIEVSGRPDERVFSADGRWLAFSGTPYFVGMESEGTVTDFGLLDLKSGEIVHESLRQPVDAVVLDVVVAGGRAWTLRSTTDRHRIDKLGRLAWFDHAGAQVGPGIEREGDTHPYEARWLPGARRVLVNDGCTYALVDLPPP
jgi:hypothetical protein